MMFLKESLYGWGVCDIPMPRATYDIFSDRRKKSILLHFLPDRRNPAVKHDTLLNISRIFIHDVPYLHLLIVSILSISCIAFIYIASKIIPQQSAKQISRVVDITIQMFEDVKNEKEIIKKKLLLEKKEKDKPEPKLPAKVTVKEKRKPILTIKEKAIPEEILPDTKRRPKIQKKTLTYAQPDIPKTSTFDKSVRSDEISIRAPLSKKQKFKINQAQSELSPFETKTSIKQRDNPVEIMFQSKSSQRNYAISRKDQDIGAPVKVFTPGQPVESDEISLLETDRTKKRYSSEKNVRPSKAQALPQTGSNLLAFPRQKDTRIQGEDLYIKPPGRSRTATNQAKRSEANLMHAKLPDLSGSITIDGIDPSQLISLNEFNVCIDPEEEFRLKTQLATLLDKPDRCGINGILFFFRYTKSAYTIKVDIYDPRGTLSGNRCSVLQLAVECVKN